MAADHVIAKITADISDLKAELQKGTAEFKKFGDKIDRVLPQDPFERIKKQAMDLVAVAAVVKPFQEAGRAAANFEAEVRNLNTITEMSEPALAKYADNLRTLSLELGTTTGAAANARAAYDVASAGFVDAAENAAVLETTLKAASAGGVEAAEAAKLISGSLRAYGASAQESEKFANVFFQTVKNGITTFPELSQSLGNVTGIAAQAGVSIEELGGAMATVTSRGIKTSTATDGLRGAIVNLLAPSQQAKDEMARLGLEINETTLKNDGLQKTLQKIRDANGGSAESFKRLLGDVQAVSVALALTGDEGALFAKNTEDMRKSTEALDAALAEKSKSFQHSMDQFKVSLEAAGVAVGQVFLPVAKALLDSVTGVITAFATAPEPIRDTITAIAGLGASIIVAKKSSLALSAMGVDFTKLRAGAVALGGGVKNLGAALTGLNAAALTATAGTGALVATAAIAVAGLALITHSALGYTEAIEQAEQAEAALVATLGRSIIKNKEALQIRKLSIDQVKEQAKTFQEYADQRVYLTQAILEAQEALHTAEKAGDKEGIRAAQDRLKAFREQRTEVDTSIAKQAEAEAAAADAAEERFAKARQAYASYKEAFDRGNFESNKKALESLEKVAAGLNGETLKAAMADISKLQSEILKEELTGLKERIAAEKVTGEESKTILADLLSKYKASASEKKKAEEDIGAAVTAQLEKREEKTRAYLAKELELKKAALAQERKLASDGGDISALEHRLSKGEDVVAQLKAELTKRTEILKTYVDEEAALERIAIKREEAAAIEADPGGASRIKQLTAEKERQLDKDTAAQKAALDQELESKKTALTERRAQLQAEAAKKEADLANESADLRRQAFEEERTAQEQRFAERRRQLEEEAALGINKAQALKDLAAEELTAKEEAAKRNLQLALDEIALKKEAANVGASAEQQKLNEQRAQLEIQKAQREARQEIQGIVDQDLEKLKQQTQELIKQRDMLKEQNEERKRGQATLGGVSGIESVNDNTGSFGVSAFGGAKTEDGRTVEDLDREISANQVKIKAKTRGKDSSSSRGSGTVWATKAKDQAGTDASGLMADASGSSGGLSAGGGADGGDGSFPGSIEEMVMYLSKIEANTFAMAKQSGSTSQSASPTNTRANADPLPTTQTPFQYTTNRS